VQNTNPYGVTTINDVTTTNDVTTKKKLTNDIERHVMVDGRGLSEINPTGVRPGIEPTNPGYTEYGRPSADPEVSPISKGGRFGPQIGSLVQLLLV